MEQKRKIRYIIVFLLLGCCVVLLCVLNICIGSVSITVFDILASIQGKAVENARILWDIRMPRMLAALILGGALGLAGYLLQTFFHNPIAGPFVLGISSGAKMTVSVVMVFLMGQAISVCRGNDFNGICATGIAKGRQYGYACCRRRNDRLYLLSHNGTCRDLCR